MSIRFVRLAIAGLTAFALTPLLTEANAQERVRWKMPSAFGSQLTHLGTSGVRFSKDIERLSGGKFEMKFFEPGAHRAGTRVFRRGVQGFGRSVLDDARLSHRQVSGARVLHHACHSGPNIGEFLAWKWFGGGNKLRDEIYAKHDLIAFDCFCIGPETSGWFRNEVKSLDEMKGLKMRFFGLGAKVMQKLGVSTQLLAAADIFPALERGVIDATEFSMPTMDIKLGFHQIAKFNYFPGWHQQISCSELLMNKKAYDALPDQYKAMIEVATQAQVIYTYAETEAKQFGVMAEMRDKHKVQIKRWPDDALKAYEKAWLDVLKEESAKRSALQEGRGPLPRLPRKIRDLGRRAVPQADLPEIAASAAAMRAPDKRRAARPGPRRARPVASRARPAR